MYRIVYILNRFISINSVFSRISYYFILRRSKRKERGGKDTGRRRKRGKDFTDLA
jgi:hypothetical protein